MLATGPPFVDVPGGYQALLKKSGWRLFERVDVSAPYAVALQGIASGMRNNVETLQEIYGSEELRAAWRHREDQLELVESGYMQRIVYAANAV